jgi:anthranilate phosphoribosyltransferase
VLLNAGASLLISGAAPDLAHGISRAGAVLDSGAAAATLERLTTLSNATTEVA